MSGKHQRRLPNKSQHIETVIVNGREVKRIVKDDDKKQNQQSKQTTSK